MEVLENKRLIEDNRIFHKELRIASDTKAEFDKLSSQLAKLDLFYERKIDENANKRNNIKVRNKCAQNARSFLCMYN